MIRLLTILVLLLISVGFGIEISRDPGYLLITMNHWTIETTVSIALASLILLFFVLHTGLLLLNKLKNSPSYWREWQHKRRIQTAQAKTRQGLIEFSEGHWLQAEKHLINALPDSDAPLLNYLTAARAAQEMGDSQLRDTYLREAQQSMPEAKIAVKLTQAQLQLANQQWEQALATLRHLQDIAPKHPYVLKLLMHLYQEVKDWPQLITLLPELKKYRVISDRAFKKLQQQTYLNALVDLARTAQTPVVATLIANLPKELASNSNIMAEYSRFLIKHDEISQAESILRACLQKQYDSNLIKIYAHINLDDKQLLFAESLLKKHPHSAELYLALGYLSIANHLWGKAKNYFEKSIKLAATPEAYAQLGHLLEKLEDHVGACTAYCQGLSLVTATRP